MSIHPSVKSTLQRLKWCFHVYMSIQIPNRYVVVPLCIAFVWCGGYVMGYEDAEVVPRVCAKVEGYVPLTSSGDKCTYVRAWGAETYRKKAY